MKSDLCERLVYLCTSDDTATVRVTNLSEDATEQDLRELFGHFGPIQRIYLARDRNSQRSKVNHPCCSVCLIHASVDL